MAVLVRVHQRGLRDRPRQEADLVDRVVDRRFVGERRQRVGNPRSEHGEPVDQAVVAQVDVGRRAVMHQGPNDLQAVAARRLRDALDAREVEAAGRLFGQAPADALAHRAQTECGGPFVVLVEAVEVAVGARHVERRAAAVQVVGTLVAAHPERTERPLGGRVGHARRAERGRSPDVVVACDRAGRGGGGSGWR
jgi:hypothetical protein